MFLILTLIARCVESQSMWTSWGWQLDHCYSYLRAKRSELVLLTLKARCVD
jgi:hypothetical protein